MPAACAIVVERLEDGRYRATCPVFPDLETSGATAEEAWAAFSDAIGAYLVGTHGEPPISSGCEANHPILPN